MKIHTLIKSINIFFVASFISTLLACKEGKTKVNPSSNTDYVLNTTYVFACDDNGNCSLLDAKTGSLVWKYKTSEYILSSPTYSNDNLYVTSIQNSSKIIAIDIKTGLEKWDFLTKEGYNASSPLVINNRLYYNSASKFYCLNAINGKPIWELKSQSFIDSSPAYYEGKIYLVGLNGLEIIDANSGALLKNARISNQKISYFDIKGVNPSHSSPSIYKDVCYYTYLNFLYAYDLKTMQTKSFSYEPARQINSSFSSPAALNDNLFVNDSYGLYSVTLPTLNKKYYKKFEGSIYNPTSPIAFDNFVVYSDDKKLYCMDSNTSNNIWFVEGRSFSSPNYYNDLVYVSTKEDLLCLDIKSGKTIWSYKLMNSNLGIIPSPLIITEKGEAIHSAISGARN
ncbi:MAG: PQQ-binding-like beta-propeller repeat protein [Leadbetterella sp.]